MIRSLRGLNLITTHPDQHTLRDLYDRNPSEEYMLAHFYLRLLPFPLELNTMKDSELERPQRPPQDNHRCCTDHEVSSYGP